MKIKNKKNKANYLNFRANGVPKKIIIPAGKTVNVSALTNVSQIINYGDFGRGFFEVIEEKIEVKTIEKKAKKKAKKKSTKKVKKLEDSLEKVEKEVKDYISNKELDN